MSETFRDFRVAEDQIANFRCIRHPQGPELKASCFQFHERRAPGKLFRPIPMLKEPNPHRRVHLKGRSAARRTQNKLEHPTLAKNAHQSRIPQKVFDSFGWIRIPSRRTHRHLLLHRDGILDGFDDAGKFDQLAIVVTIRPPLSPTPIIRACRPIRPLSWAISAAGRPAWPDACAMGWTKRLRKALHPERHQAGESRQSG